MDGWGGEGGNLRENRWSVPNMGQREEAKALQTGDLGSHSDFNPSNYTTLPKPLPCSEPRFPNL